MTRYLKVLGPVLVGTLALSALIASAALAQGKLTSDGPVKLTASETGVGANYFRAFGLTIQCPGSTYTGTGVGSKTELIPVGSTTATLTPKYKEANENCNVTPGNFKAIIEMKSCDYVLHLGATDVTVADTYKLAADVVCTDPKDEITVKIWTNSTDLTKPTTPMCILHIKPQSGLAGAHATGTGNGTIDVAGTFKEIHVQKTSTGTHALLCMTDTTNAGEYGIDVNVTGENNISGATAIALTD